ncbi:MAG: DUF3429 domain-containing protein [Rhizobiaceae bacterium]
MAESTDHDAPDASDLALPRAGSSLAWFGTTPFVVLSVWLYAIASDHPWRDGTIELLVIYAALFLSFLGGVRWGTAMTADRAKGSFDLVVSVLPMLAAWASFALETPYTFAALAVLFAAAGAWDALSAGDRATPAWYGRLRVRQTAVIVATMVLAFAATG